MATMPVAAIDRRPKELDLLQDALVGPADPFPVAFRIGHFVVVEDDDHEGPRRVEGGLDGRVDAARACAPVSSAAAKGMALPPCDPILLAGLEIASIRQDTRSPFSHWAWPRSPCPSAHER
jgi:hypothetical protein